MVSSPRPAWAFFVILFLFHRSARTFFQSVPVILWHRAVSTPFWLPTPIFFDAPKTDMVFIARQGLQPRPLHANDRGLRGEKNGRTARCRLVTVIDNLGRFAERHPYHFCARYFSAAAP